MSRAYNIFSLTMRRPPSQRCNSVSFRLLQGSTRTAEHSRLQLLSVHSIRSVAQIMSERLLAVAMSLMTFRNIGILTRKDSGKCQRNIGSTDSRWTLCITMEHNASGIYVSAKTIFMRTYRAAVAAMLIALAAFQTDGYAQSRRTSTSSSSERQSSSSARQSSSSARRSSSSERQSSSSAKQSSSTSRQSSSSVRQSSSTPRQSSSSVRQSSSTSRQGSSRKRIFLT